MSLLAQFVVLLGAAVCAVLLSKRLGMGSVIGYLAAGATVGPWGLHIAEDTDALLHLAEYGIVLLLFIIGLELQASRLWTLRRSIFGLGGAQVVSSGLAIAAVGIALGLSWRTAAIVGVALSLSSTAFALQILAERNQLTSRHGRSAFSILLFQDILAIPVLALLPLLADGTATVDVRSLWVDALAVIAALAGVILGGRYLVRPLLRLVARAQTREVFAATALLTVVGTALIVESVGLSMALGAFLAGVLLADSEFRHALEADIEPFKGLLLGLFFMGVGMSVNFGFLAAHLAAVLLLATALLAVKFVVLFAIGMTSRYGVRSSLFFASAISQGGEFAFVIFNIAAGVRLLPAEIADLLVLTVILSMALTPLLMYAVDRLLAVRPERRTGPIDIAVPEDNQVIIAGFGRYGQIVGRILRAKKIGFTALEISQEQIDFVTKFGAKVYYGDASRPDVLRAARADKAVALVLAIDDVEASLRLAATVKAEFPNLTVLARARNRQHAHRLMDTGVAAINRETLLSSLDTARRLLEVLGLPDYQAARIVETFRRSDEKRFLDEHELIGDEKKLIEDANLWARELEQIFEQDIASEQGGRGRGEIPPAAREAVRRRR